MHAHYNFLKLHASRAALADGDLHRKTIAAAGRKAWEDAYNSTPQLGAGRRPLQTVELSTLVYPYRHHPRYAVEVVHETILEYELQGYDVGWRGAGRASADAGCSAAASAVVAPAQGVGASPRGVGGVGGGAARAPPKKVEKGRKRS